LDALKEVPHLSTASSAPVVPSLLPRHVQTLFELRVPDVVPALWLSIKKALMLHKTNWWMSVAVVLLGATGTLPRVW
jgi:hypothetical protein